VIRTLLQHAPRTGIDGSVTGPESTPLTGSAPANGQVLQWSTNVWEPYTLPSFPTSLPPDGTAGGDLSGTYPDPVVAQLQGEPISTSAPQTGNALRWNGTNYVTSGPYGFPGTRNTFSYNIPATNTWLPMVTLTLPNPGAYLLMGYDLYWTFDSNTTAGLYTYITGWWTISGGVLQSNLSQQVNVFNFNGTGSTTEYGAHPSLMPVSGEAGQQFALAIWSNLGGSFVGAANYLQF